MIDDGTDLEKNVPHLGSAIHLATLCGPQDLYLHDDVTGISHFKFRHQAHTPFEMRHVMLDPMQTPTYGSTARFDVPRGAAMLGELILHITLPAPGPTGGAGQWVDTLGYAMLRRCRLCQGTTTLHESERLWWDISDKLNGALSKRPGLDKMIGRGQTLGLVDEQALFVPLKVPSSAVQYGFGSRPNAMPLISVPGEPLFVEFDLEDLDALIKKTSPVPAADVVKALGFTKPSLRLEVEVMYLETPEINHILSSPRTNVFEAAQDVETLNYVESSDGTKMYVDRISLDFSEVGHPCKNIVVVAYPEDWGSSFFQYEKNVFKSIKLCDGDNELVSQRDAAYFGLAQRSWQGSGKAGDDGISQISLCLAPQTLQTTGYINFAAARRGPVLLCDLATQPEPKRPLIIKAFANVIKLYTYDKGVLELMFL